MNSGEWSLMLAEFYIPHTLKLSESQYLQLRRNPPATWIWPPPPSVRKRVELENSPIGISKQTWGKMWGASSPEAAGKIMSAGFGEEGVNMDVFRNPDDPEYKYFQQIVSPRALTDEDFSRLLRDPGSFVAETKGAIMKTPISQLEAKYRTPPAEARPAVARPEPTLHPLAQPATTSGRPIQRAPEQRAQFTKAQNAMAIRMGEMKPEEDGEAAAYAKVMPYDELDRELKELRKSLFKKTKFPFKPLAEI